MEQVIQVPLQGSEAVDATRLVRLLRRILNDTDSDFLLRWKLSPDETRKWRDSRKAIYFDTLTDLAATVTSRINEYSLIHLSRGTEWVHIQNTFRFKLLSAFYIAELRIAGYAYFLGIRQAIPAADRVLQNLLTFVQPLVLVSVPSD